MSHTKTLSRPTLKSLWSNAWSEPAFRYHYLSVVIGAIIIALVVPDFFAYIDSRTGTPLEDPFLDWLPAYDVSWPAFIVLYSSVILGAIFLLRYPKSLLLCLQAYCLVTFMRMGSVLLISLEPPVDIIPLNDPFVSSFADGKPVYRDLFFSGHTSTMFLLYLTARPHWLRWIFLATTVLMGLFVLIQHVHYTVDVLGAPFFVWLSYTIVKKINPLRDELKYSFE
jgi:hypothetical protein